MKTVLITGANRGLGLELVKVFSKNQWQVTAACRDISNAPQEIKDDKNVNIVPLDVANQESINSLAKQLETTPIDVLINNAAVYDNLKDGAPVFTGLDDILNVVLIDGIAPRLIAEALLPSLHEGQEKLIVNISSNQGVISLADQYHSLHWPYGAGKAALNWSMATFSKVYPQIKSVLINPGWMKTRLGGDDAPVRPEESAQKIYNLVIDHKSKLLDGHLVDREGKLIEW